MSEQLLDELENQREGAPKVNESSLGAGSDLADETNRSIQIERGQSSASEPPSSLPPLSPQDNSNDDSQSTGPTVVTPSSSTTTLNPMIADDADLIEKEWVEKAKSIVEQTKEDPREQNRQLTNVKADYLKKRYNHDLKPSDE